MLCAQRACSLTGTAVPGSVVDAGRSAWRGGGRRSGGVDRRAQTSAASVTAFSDGRAGVDQRHEDGSGPLRGGDSDPNWLGRSAGCRGSRAGRAGPSAETRAACPRERQHHRAGGADRGRLRRHWHTNCRSSIDPERRVRDPDVGSIRIVGPPLRHEVEGFDRVTTCRLGTRSRRTRLDGPIAMACTRPAMSGAGRAVSTWPPASQVFGCVATLGSAWTAAGSPTQR